jgi:hypothetical protein
MPRKTNKNLTRVYLNKKKLLKNNVFILIFLKKLKLKFKTKNKKTRGGWATPCLWGWPRATPIGWGRPPLAFSFFFFFFFFLKNKFIYLFFNNFIFFY